MGKYPTPTIATPEWAIANELAEMNRLKRVEMMNYVGMKVNQVRSHGLELIANKDLEDQA